jgi:FeS assembly SUF system protein
MSEKINKEEVIQALKNCYDPEIPINIVDLGLIYDLKIEGNKVTVVMTLTAPFCPAAIWFPDYIKQELLKVKGVKEAEVKIVWEPRWTPDRMSEEAKALLGIE